MFKKLKSHFGIPGLIAVAALVFAMLGGAWAASGPDGGKAGASAKGKQGPRGKRGPKGATGAAGPAGPAGPAGAPGAKGDAGAQGAPGTNGTDGDDGDDGKSVLIKDATEFDCEDLGGVIVEVEGSPASAKEVCNGKDGAKGDKGDKGDKGSPWTPDNALPASATTTGTWGFTANDADDTIWVPISFPIPLGAFEIPIENVHYQNIPSETVFLESCPGDVNNPQADPGHLCVFHSEFNPPVNATFDFISAPDRVEERFPEEAGANKAGAVLQFSFSGGAGTTATGSGTFAVTG